jgi:O-antigen/teichoic acid export membrane protein
VLLAAVLGPSGQGGVALASLVGTFGAAALGLGLDVALMRAAADDDARADADAALWLQSAMVAVVGAGGLVVALLAGAAAPIVAGIASVPPLLFMRLLSARALGTGRRAVFAVVTVAPWAVYAGALTVLAAADALTLRHAVTTFATVMLASSVTAAVYAALKVAQPRWRAPWRSNAYATALRIAPGVLAQLTTLRFDQVVIAAFLTRAQLGIYAFAVAATEVATLPAQAAANTVLPASSGAAPPSVRRAFAVATGAGAIVVLVVPVFLAVMLLGLPEYHASLGPFFLLVPGTMALAAGRVLTAYLIGRGRTWEPSRIAICTAIVSVCLMLLLVPLFDVEGAAAGSSVAYLVSALLLARSARALPS